MPAARSLTFNDIPTLRRPRFSKDEFMRRGKELYERLRPEIEEGNRGKIVAIDLDTGTFEVAADTLQASKRLLARCPDAQTWFVRIGYDDLFRIGRGTALNRA
jgi:hypothetical protein